MCEDEIYNKEKSSEHSLEEYKKRKVVPTRLKYEDYYKDNKKPSEQALNSELCFEDRKYCEKFGYILVKKSDLEDLFSGKLTNEEHHKFREKYLPEPERFEPCETEGEGDNIRYL